MSIPRKPARSKRDKTKTSRKVEINGQFDQGRISPEQIVERPIDSIRPAPENEKLYRPVSPDDPEILALAASIREHGIREPLVITLDGVLISGHRRHCAARLVSLATVPVRVEPIHSTDSQFLTLLREANRQRVKTLAEVTREQVLDADPEEAYRVLVEHRQKQSHIDATGAFDIIGHKRRAKISKAKAPMLEAILEILRDRRGFWPLSIRQIHYALLNTPPLIHASKPASRYANTLKSYKAAIDLIGRARLEGLIPWDAIDDETRTVTTWDVHLSIAPFIHRELDQFLKGYYRDLLQSQPNQIEIVGEKNTIKGIIRPLAAEYRCPFAIGRGYASFPMRQKMCERFKASGKEKLIVLMLGDFDPEGEDICHSFARSMRDDFGVTAIVPIKVTLTREQIDVLQLPPQMTAKETSSRHDGFVGRHGKDVYELEAIPPEELQRLLRVAIDSKLDVAAFNAEVEAEKREAAHLDAVRRAVQVQLATVKFE